MIISVTKSSKRLHNLHSVFRDEKKDFGDWNGLYVLAVKSRTEAAVKRIIDKVRFWFIDD